MRETDYRDRASLCEEISAGMATVLELVGQMRSAPSSGRMPEKRMVGQAQAHPTDGRKGLATGRA